jgi:hypothetical protein
MFCTDSSEDVAVCPALKATRKTRTERPYQRSVRGCNWWDVSRTPVKGLLVSVSQ